jgi:stearoyl-CoA desaturase (Delta-9 desaturase)
MTIPSVYAPKPLGYRIFSYVGTLPFFLLHAACFIAIWTGVSWWSLAMCFVLYYVRMFGVTAGYHRYFSHRSYKASRVVQFLIAVLAQSSAQKGALWWAAHHRHHHKTSDTPEDRHAPKYGFWNSHVGWILNPSNDETALDLIPDLAKFPELRFLDRFHLLPPFALGAASYFFGMWMGGAWEGLVVGFFWSTVLCWHGTFTINSLTHLWGKRVYPTTDDSKNSFILALITCGEGWHNNHHYYQASARQGFRWWQIDLSFYALTVMSWVGLVSKLKEPPKQVLELGLQPSVLSADEVIAAQQVAAQLNAEQKSGHTATVADNRAAPRELPLVISAEPELIAS